VLSLKPQVGSSLIREMMKTMNRSKLKKVAIGAAATGALGLASVGLGAGQAQADPDWCLYNWCDVVPAPGHFVPSPGHIGHVTGVPPGHWGQITGVPPGHWNKPWKW
jgi:hypothetical protein